MDASESSGVDVIAIQGLNASLGSTDFSLLPTLEGELKPDHTRAESLLKGFRGVAGESGKAGRLAYLQGRLLQREVKHRQAIEQFMTLHRTSPAAVEPARALATSLGSIGDAREAENVLGRTLNETCPGARELWDAWLAVSMGDLGRGAEDVLARLPCQGRVSPEGESAPAIGGSYRATVHGLLERLQAGDDLVFRCGGDATRNTEAGGARGDDFLVLSPEASYRIPLPRGRYRVTLHVAVPGPDPTGPRAFEFLIEGERVLGRIEPSAPNATEVVLFHRAVQVRDGLLDIDLQFRIENPQISAIEIETL